MKDMQGYKERMSNNSPSLIRIFKNPEFGKVRILVIDNEPWFCLPDICKCLGILNPSTVKTRLFPDGVQLIDIQGLIDPDGLEINILGNSMVNFVSEPNLFNCVVASRKKDAKKFQQWICKEVLPFVRKTEEYSTEEESREVQLARALIAASATIQETEERRRLAHAEAVRRGTLIREMKPKAEYFDEMIDAGEARGIRDTAHLLGMKEKEFVWWLTEKKFLYRDKKGRLKPYSKHVGKIFVTKDFETKKFSGSQVMVSAEGRLYFKKIINIKK